MFHTIMVAYDESREAAHALASAIELAKALGTHLKIVTVVEALPAFYNIARGSFLDHLLGCSSRSHFGS